MHLNFKFKFYLLPFVEQNSYVVFPSDPNYEPEEDILVVERSIQTNFLETSRIDVEMGVEKRWTS
jgi:hypothetical protein